jgi:hypothetical protein
MIRNHGIIQLQGCSEAEGAPPSWHNVAEVVVGIYQHAVPLPYASALHLIKHRCQV